MLKTAHRLYLKPHVRKKKIQIQNKNITKNP